METIYLSICLSIISFVYCIGLNLLYLWKTIVGLPFSIWLLDTGSDWVQSTSLIQLDFIVFNPNLHTSLKVCLSITIQAYFVGAVQGYPLQIQQAVCYVCGQTKFSISKWCHSRCAEAIIGILYAHSWNFGSKISSAYFHPLCDVNLKWALAQGPAHTSSDKVWSALL